jgi:hypothetical protein
MKQQQLISSTNLQRSSEFQLILRRRGVVFLVLRLDRVHTWRIQFSTPITPKLR